jgi:hypothetical protein
MIGRDDRMQRRSAARRWPRSHACPSDPCQSAVDLPPALTCAARAHRYARHLGGGMRDDAGARRDGAGRSPSRREIPWLTFATECEPLSVTAEGPPPHPSRPPPSSRRCRRRAAPDHARIAGTSNRALITWRTAAAGTARTTPTTPCAAPPTSRTRARGARTHWTRPRESARGVSRELHELADHPAQLPLQPDKPGFLTGARVSVCMC